MDKFLRAYRLSVEASNGEMITVQNPFTIEFDITRNILSSANTSQIRIYNLSTLNRDKIRKDVWSYNDLRKVELAAGYDINLPVIFRGNISQAFSVREGTNFVTQIESFDAGFAFVNGVTAKSFPVGTSLESMLSDLLVSLPDVKKGAVGSYPGVITRGNTFNGNTTDILRELSAGGFFIDNGIAHCLGDTECLLGEIATIDSATGLLGTPIREQTYLNFDILFEPRLQIGQIVELNSLSGANFNGLHKVISLKHKGTISDAICGNAVTSVGLFAPSFLEVVG